jgi:hypothetical protein
MSSKESYRGQDGSLFRIIRLTTKSNVIQIRKSIGRVNQQTSKRSQDNPKPKGANKEDSVQDFETEISDLPRIESTRNKSKVGLLRISSQASSADTKPLSNEGALVKTPRHE